MADKVFVLFNHLPTEGIKKFQRLLENYNIVVLLSFCSAILLLVFVFEMVEATLTIISSH